MRKRRRKSILFLKCFSVNSAACEELVALAALPSLARLHLSVPWERAEAPAVLARLLLPAPGPKMLVLEGNCEAVLAAAAKLSAGASSGAASGASGASGIETLRLICGVLGEEASFDGWLSRLSRLHTLARARKTTKCKVV